MNEKSELLDPGGVEKLSLMEHKILKKTLHMIKDLKSQIRKQQIVEPIAIVGLSCRFPHVKNKDDYWRLLCEGGNVISQIPEERWKLLAGTNEFHSKNNQHTYWGGFLENIDLFDAYFFGITPREAVRMDPQQRILLEVTYEAILDAGLSMESLAGTKTGVFVGLYASQFGYLQKLDSAMDALYIPTGNAISIAANRISYIFDLLGPSMVIDTACSSSLVAVDLACLHIQNKLCDQALVGGVNINLLPSHNLMLAEAKMLSPDGQCKTFDAQANGYVQGEGAGVIVLKPLSKALENNDQIYAVITGSAVNQDGKTNGLTAPNGLLQEEVLKSAYRNANIEAKNISYIECHGTGTYLGDPIEVQALGSVINENRHKESPCWIGSVKTNLGHLEPAAGIASIIKVALALKNSKIPPHRNFSQPNPYIGFSKYNLAIPQVLLDWPKYGMNRIAGISGFGFGGTNAHVVLRDLSENEKGSDSTVNKSIHNWQHKIYWPIFETKSKVNFPIHYPLQGKKINSPLKTLQFEFIFDTKILPEIEDTYHILHVGFYLEMLGFVTEELNKKILFTIEDMQFYSPIIVSPGSQIAVQLILEPQDEKYVFHFFTNTSHQKQWLEHVMGNISFKTSSINNISLTLRNTSEYKPAQEFFDRVLSMGMPAGKTIRWTHQYWLGKNEILCEFQEPPFCKNGNYKLKNHPGIIDACVQPLFLLLPDKANPYVVSKIKKLTYFGNTKEKLFLLAIKKDLTLEKGTIVDDWFLVDPLGEVVIACENMTMSELTKKINIQDLANTNRNKFDLSSLSFAERNKQVIDFLLEQTSIIFSMPKEDIDISCMLSNMGIDSLMALVFIRVIETSFSISIPLQTLLEGHSLTQIAEIILENSVVQSSQTLHAPVTPWIAYRKKQVEPLMRLFCFPYGGSGASLYREWQQQLPNTIEVCPIQFPGREDRLEEERIIDLETLLESILKNLWPYFDIPFAFYGHSFGSLISFELTRLLRRKELSLPAHLFIAAFPDPKIPAKSLDNLINQLAQINIDLSHIDNSAAIAKLSDAQVNQISAIFNENGITDYGDHLKNKEIIQILLPLFVSDMNLVKRYQYQDESPLDVPITVFLGKKDAWVSYEEHFQWKKYTNLQCDFHEFDSGHLFIRDNTIRKNVLEQIAHKLVDVAVMSS